MAIPGITVGIGLISVASTAIEYVSVLVLGINIDIQNQVLSVDTYVMKMSVNNDLEYRYSAPDYLGRYTSAY